MLVDLLHVNQFHHLEQRWDEWLKWFLGASWFFITINTLFYSLNQNIRNTTQAATNSIVDFNVQSSAKLDSLKDSIVDFNDQSSSKFDSLEDSITDFNDQSSSKLDSLENSLATALGAINEQNSIIMKSIQQTIEDGFEKISENIIKSTESLDASSVGNRYLEFL